MPAGTCLSEREAHAAGRDRPPQTDDYPPNLRLVEELTYQLRRELRRLGLGTWEIFCTNIGPIDPEDILRQPEVYGEGDLEWQPLPLTDNREQPGRLGAHWDNGERDLFCRRAGLLWLKASGVVIARWMYWDPIRSRWELMELLAVESMERLEALHRRVSEVGRTRDLKDWVVVTGPLTETWSRQTGINWDSVLLAAPLRRRLMEEVVGFFSDAARKLYAELGVPYRRGALLYGPPGNGKTSIIRIIGASLPNIATMVLQPHATFDDDDLAMAIRRWEKQAPAMLVIEDIDALFDGKVKVSNFLNIIDGITTGCDSGLLLVGTSNHPDRLDPAIANRPGRFDVVMEIPPPSKAQRRAYLSDKRPRD